MRVPLAAQRSKHETLWRDPAHWTPLGLYRCADDPRVWVPKRDPGIGWTLNVAHRRAWVSFALLLLATAGPGVAMVVLDARDAPIVWGSLAIAPFLVLIVFVIAFGARKRE